VMSKASNKGNGERKIQQVVWLPVSVMARVLSYASMLGLAPNQVISLIVQKYFEGVDKGEITPFKEVKVQLKIYRCPFCNMEFNDPSECIEHLAENHSDKLKIEGWK